jgi:hypothetical protein
MPGSGRFMNWSNVDFQIGGTGTPTPIKEVTNLTINPRATLLGASGDADAGPSAKTLNYSDPQITITLEDLAILATLIPGTRGTLHATHNDFYNGAGTGAMIYAITNCIVGDTQRGGAHRAAGTGTLTIETSMPDGQTNPIAVTFAA